MDDLDFLIALAELAPVNKATHVKAQEAADRLRVVLTPKPSGGVPVETKA